MDYPHMDSLVHHRLKPWKNAPKPFTNSTRRLGQMKDVSARIFLVKWERDGQP
jgi:hypothetical protein